ncbi:MAG: Fis family transcriptional regulator [Acidobacteriia bacterium]|nr:Fis family transcriptional regulator [Terriglobia bacterium]
MPLGPRFALALAISGAAFGQKPPGPPAPFAREMLAAHNAVRARLKLPPLAWSDRLADWAQSWAEALVYKHEFVHRPRNPYGENLFEVTGGRSTPDEVVGVWAAEASAYDAKANACRAMCGHYTQIVWRDTRRVGCAVARGPDLQVWVCNYDPPGNIVGRRPY